MNLIFLTMSRFDDLDAHNIYADLLKEFIAHGHKPYLVTPCNDLAMSKTVFEDRGSYAVLQVKATNIGSPSFIRKGFATVRLEQQYISAVKAHLSAVSFELILYSTPPVTFAKVIEYLKMQCAAPAYLLLKDIFPQNAVDLAMFKKGGLIHRYFRLKESKLYAISDYIGCMSQANVDYLLRHNAEIDSSRVHISPNSIQARTVKRNSEDNSRIRSKYGIPQTATVFVYGGNMGKPQDIPFIIRCLRLVSNQKDKFFVLCGDGSEYNTLKAYMETEKPSNVLLIKGLPKKEYDELLLGCDVGLIFLDHRFTIPNFPSRMLSYMEYAMPVLACTDAYTDIGRVITNGGFGWWCEASDPDNFQTAVTKILTNCSIMEKGVVGRAYLEEHFSVSKQYNTIYGMVAKS